MMEKLLRVTDIQKRYGCSRQTAVRYMQRMEHMEKPYAVRESVLTRWEQERTVRSPEVVRAEMIREKLNRRGVRT